MKYTLEFYGWEMEAIGHKLTNEQVDEIKNLMEENGYDELYECRFDLEDEGIVDDLYNPNLFHISKPLYNDRLYAIVKDDKGNTVLEIPYEDFGDVYDNIGDDDVLEKEYPSEDYLAIPEYMDKTDNVLLIVDENKGGIFETSFESDEEPKASDFSIMGGIIETPEGDWDFVSRLFFKDKELEPEDYLDNSGKASTMEIYTINGETIS